ncbi:MAG: respiratory nitrate reductase subunit gamma, partial [Dehalococcoidia bacterium]|nr:respiratory nitrate reductase subunit gamma [Dehalococcoidia bacterium]
SYVLGQIGRALVRGPTYGYILSNVVLQRQMLKESFTRWFMHISLMWGLAGLFLIGSLGNMAMDLHLVPFGKDTPWFTVLNELFGLLVLLGAAVALSRRYIFGVHQLKSTLDDIIIMAGVGIGVISGYFLEVARLDLENVSAGVAGYSFVAQWSRQWLPAQWPWGSIQPTVWWFHFLLGSGLGAYLPHSKLFHVLVSPLSVIAFSLRDAGRLRA